MKKNILFTIIFLLSIIKISAQNDNPEYNLRVDPDSTEVWFYVADISPNKLGIFYFNTEIEQQIDTLSFWDVNMKTLTKNNIKKIKQNYYAADSLRKESAAAIRAAKEDKAAMKKGETIKSEADALEEEADKMLNQINFSLKEKELKIQKFNSIYEDENRLINLKLLKVGKNGTTIKPTEVLVFDLSAAINNKEVTKSEVKSPKVTQLTDVSSIKGLFYTVQIGVYSRELAPKELMNVKPIFIMHLQNRKIRYASCIFDNLKRAEEARDIIIKWGITDAWVTAYHDGIRITKEQAEEITSKDNSLYVKGYPELNVLPRQGADTKIVKNSLFKPQ
jgi:hypothetical protein